MRSVSVRLEDLQKVTIPLGFEGENLYTQVRIDCKKIFDEDQSFVPTLVIVAPSGEQYPGIVTRDGNIVTWEVSASDLTSKGTGELQLAFTKDEIIGKTYVARTRIERSIIPSGEVPTVIENFIIEAGEIVNGIPQMIDDALAEAKASGEFDGFSPVITVTDITGGHRVTITDVNGTQTVDVMDGEQGDTGVGIASIIKTGTSGLVDTYTITYTNGNTTTFTVTNGKNGEDGQDGYSPTAKVVKNGKTATITITDKNGTTQATVSDGEDADPTMLIDDTSTAQNKVWSASKTSSEVSNLNTAIQGKQDAPASGSAAGKVLGLTEVSNELVPTWVSQPSVPVTDVQVNGISVLSQGVADVPVGSGSQIGVASFASSNGIAISSAGAAYINTASDAEIKAGSNTRKPITPSNQNKSVFYGLASAAGDTTQSASSSPVGQYTPTAEEKILNMIGAEKVITLTGSTPTITAIRNGRYICGEVSTLDFTPCSSGDCEVIFESGSTATVLTVPNTVKFPEWFDATSLEANRTYDIIITDATYGVVTSWA